MSGLRWYLSTETGVTVEVTDRVNWPDIGVGGMAEPGGAWAGELILDDPNGDLIPLAYRRIYCNDDDAVGEQVIGNWFITRLKVRREGQSPVLAARTWVLSIADENSLLKRRKFVGSDADRPEETDIERIRWMLASTELNVLDPNEDFIDTTGPITLDAAPLANQDADGILASIMGRTGKQYWVMYREDLTPHVYTLCYYNPNTSTLYPSTVSLSNIASEVGDPTSTLVYALSQSAELDRDPGRMASGLLGPWKQKVEYIQDTTVGDTYAYVDQIAGDLYNVTTEASAIAQITRQLAELALPDDEITTTWTVESDNLNLIKHGMRLPVHVSHFPNYTDDSDPTREGYLEPGYAAGFVWCRVMERTVRQVGPTTFEVLMRLSPQPIASCSVSFGSTVLNQITDQAGASGSYNIAVTPTAHSAIIAGFVAGGTGMTLGGTGFTTLDSYANTGHETFANGWAVASSTETVTASYSITGNPQAAVIAAFLTSATAPVQTAVGTWGNGPLTATLASPPTPGNMLVAVVTGSANRNPMTLGPSSLWALIDGLGHTLTFLDEGQCNGVHPFGGDAVAVFAGCVEAGFGADWTYGGSGASSHFYAVTIMEWAIT